MEAPYKAQTGFSGDLKNINSKANSSLVNMKGMSRSELESLVQNYQAYQTEVEEFIQALSQTKSHNESSLNPCNYSAFCEFS